MFEECSRPIGQYYNKSYKSRIEAGDSSARAAAAAVYATVDRFHREVDFTQTLSLKFQRYPSRVRRRFENVKKSELKSGCSVADAIAIAVSRTLGQFPEVDLCPPTSSEHSERRQGSQSSSEQSLEGGVIVDGSADAPKADKNTFRDSSADIWAGVTAEEKNTRHDSSAGIWAGLAAGYSYHESSADIWAAEDRNIGDVATADDSAGATTERYIAGDVAVTDDSAGTTEKETTTVFTTDGSAGTQEIIYIDETTPEALVEEPPAPTRPSADTTMDDSTEMTPERLAEGMAVTPEVVAFQEWFLKSPVTRPMGDMIASDLVGAMQVTTGEAHSADGPLDEMLSNPDPEEIMEDSIPQPIVLPAFDEDEYSFQGLAFGDDDDDFASSHGHNHANPDRAVDADDFSLIINQADDNIEDIDAPANEAIGVADGQNDTFPEVSDELQEQETRRIARLLGLKLAPHERLRINGSREWIDEQRAPDACWERTGKGDKRVYMRVARSLSKKALEKHIKRFEIYQGDHCVTGPRLLRLKLVCPATSNCVCVTGPSKKIFLSFGQGTARLYAWLKAAFEADWEKILAICCTVDERGHFLENSHVCVHPEDILFSCQTLHHSLQETKAQNLRRSRHQRGQIPCDCTTTCRSGPVNGDGGSTARTRTVQTERAAAVDPLLQTEGVATVLNNNSPDQTAGAAPDLNIDPLLQTEGVATALNNNSSDQTAGRVQAAGPSQVEPSASLMAEGDNWKCSGCGQVFLQKLKPSLFRRHCLTRTHIKRSKPEYLPVLRQIAAAAPRRITTSGV